MHVANGYIIVSLRKFDEVKTKNGFKFSITLKNTLWNHSLKPGTSKSRMVRQTNIFTVTESAFRTSNQS